MTAGRRSTAFLLVYALANAGGTVAYLPLLTLLLPVKIAGLAGDARIGVFTATVVAGALAAGGSNVLFGWLSDRSVALGRGRRGWVAAGIAATVASYAGVAAAATPVAIVLAVAAFQFAVNALLAPLLAIMADEIPDAQKGVAGGLLALANPVASATSAVVIGVSALDEPRRFAVIALAVALCVAPILFARGRTAEIAPRPAPVAAMLRRDLAIAWGARLLAQVAGSVLSLYLLYYFASVAPTLGDRDLALGVSQLLTIAYIVPLPIAVALGRLSDSIGRRKPVLLGGAAVAALGLVVMALAGGWREGAAGLALYAIGSSVFLTLHNAFAMQLLPDPAHRGRDLGLLNLTNTLPGLVGALLTWTLATPSDFGGVMLALAALVVCGGVAMLGVRGQR